MVWSQPPVKKTSDLLIRSGVTQEFDFKKFKKWLV